MYKSGASAPLNLRVPESDFHHKSVTGITSSFFDFFTHIVKFPFQPSGGTKQIVELKMENAAIIARHITLLLNYRKKSFNRVGTFFFDEFSKNVFFDDTA